MYAFSLDGVRVAHLGDLGQSILRGEQAAALGQIDLLFVPVGDGPTIGASLAHEIATTLGARWVVPMHYRTRRTNFLEPADAFLERFASVCAAGRRVRARSVEGGAVARGALATFGSSACRVNSTQREALDGESDLHGQGGRDRRARRTATA